jgi:hypothetical protein
MNRKNIFATLVLDAVLCALSNRVFAPIGPWYTNLLILVVSSAFSYLFVRVILINAESSTSS